jgi:hypothetical protein
MWMISNNYLFLGIIFVVLSCGQKPESKQYLAEETTSKKAGEIVSLSIEKHGGLSTWKNLESISYYKSIILFDSLGVIESKVTQHHYYQLKPELTGTISWLVDGDSLKIEYANNEATKYVNGLAEISPESLNSAKNSFLSSFYVLFQPFKLMDEGTELNYVGVDTLESDVVVNVIQPSYTGAKPGDDKWWYYFDIKTNRLLANMVNHSPTYSYIVNLSYDESTEIIFNAHRKSYFVDSLRNVRYLRAEYFYDDYIIKGN